MDFTHRKLPVEAAEKMRVCPIHTVQPFALMLAPTYVYLRTNEKFIAVKGPLDFFSPKELEKVSSMANFYFTDFVDQVLPFRDRAKTLRALMTWRPLGEGANALPPSSFELSDSVTRLVGPLWGEGAEIEPFFVAVFINELCELLPGELLLQAREQDAIKYERAVITSAWATFLAIHLGCCEIGFLSRFRKEVFEELMEFSLHEAPNVDLDEIKIIARATAWSVEPELFSKATLQVREEKVAQKILSRLSRIEESLVVKDALTPTIHGQKGFLNV